VTAFKKWRIHGLNFTFSRPMSAIPSLDNFFAAESRITMARSVWILALIAGAMLAQPLAASAAENGAKNRSKTEKRGGYSYNQADSINTYGDARGKYGSANSLRDPQLDRQTNAGPFDHGFFYESGVGSGQHGGNAPFLH
jgi:hypothetical protein